MPKLFFSLLFFLSFCAGAQQRFQFTQPKMGSPFNLIFYANDSVEAAQLSAASFALVDSLNQIFSDYIESSELNRLSKAAANSLFVSVSPPLYDVLYTSKKASLESNGAFDITIGPLSQLWRKMRKENKFPAKEEVQKARTTVDIGNIILDSTTTSVRLLKKNMQLDLGGVAKGYVAQQVIQFLQKKGIGSALADAGGDLVCSNPPPGKQGWTVGINVPESTTELLPQTIEINNSAVATSGDLYQYIEHGGKRYSHIIDPRKGYGVPFQRNVTVIARDGATADWLATACSILPLRKCKKLVKRHGAHLLITQLKKGRITYYGSNGMKKC